jgi:predicted ArsR family transcriptional regulator
MRRDVRKHVHPSWIPVLTDPLALSLLLALAEEPGLTVSALGRRCHVSPRAVRRQLDGLSAIGLVAEQPGKRDGLTPGRPASRFVLDAEVSERLQPFLALLAAPLRPDPR